MIKRFLSYYHPAIGVYLTYMLQQVEYNPYKFMAWAIKFPRLTKIMHRKELDWTKKAWAIVIFISTIYIFYLTVILTSIFQAPLSALLVAVFAPIMILLTTFLAIFAAWVYIEEPKRGQQIRQASKIFADHPGTTIAVTGSYGKTSMKEILNTVLSESMNVAYTPGNKNVPVSHARWAKTLSGQEDILIVEYGEGSPGDIKKMAKLSQPDYAVITGLAPNHLDQYKSIDALAEDLLSLRNHVDPDKLFINRPNELFADFNTNDLVAYDESGLLGWEVKDVRVSFSGTSFKLKKGKKAINIKSKLLGRHQVAPLSLAAVLSYNLGCKIDKIEKGITKIEPYEHRMQLKELHGAKIIDDTYNGSLEGIKAGLDLLKSLKAKRKIYITPGLVDQGQETKRVHNEIGDHIARANPNKVVLMQNSVTQDIIKGLEAANYKGDLQIQADPLEFYVNLEHMIAAGDLVMMQNDWTDNYS